MYQSADVAARGWSLIFGAPPSPKHHPVLESDANASTLSRLTPHGLVGGNALPGHAVRGVALRAPPGAGFDVGDDKQSLAPRPLEIENSSFNYLSREV